MLPGCQLLMSTGALLYRVGCTRATSVAGVCLSSQPLGIMLSSSSSYTCTAWLTLGPRLKDTRTKSAMAPRKWGSGTPPTGVSRETSLLRGPRRRLRQYTLSADLGHCVRRSWLPWPYAVRATCENAEQDHEALLRCSLGSGGPRLAAARW